MTGHIRRRRPTRSSLKLEKLEPRIALASDWQNPAIETDVSNDGKTTAVDALVVVNRLSIVDDSPTPVLSETRRETDPYYDVTGDEDLTARDALVVINRLAQLTLQDIHERRAVDNHASAGDEIQVRIQDLVTDSLVDAISYRSIRPLPVGMTLDGELGTIGWTIGTHQDATRVPVTIHIERANSPDLQVSWLITIDGPNLIANPSFEEYQLPVGRPQDDPRWVTYQGGDAGLAGWDVTSSSVDLKVRLWDASDGSNSVDLAGSPGPGGVMQQVDVVPGANYRLTFALAGNYAFGPQVKTLNVDVDQQQSTFTFDTAGKSLRNMGWVDHEIEFQATGPTVDIHFSTDNPQNWGPVIDHVRLVRTFSTRLGN